MAIRTYTDAQGRARYAIEFQQGGRRIHRRCPPGITRAAAKELEVRLRREAFAVDSLQHQQEVPLAAAIQLWLESTLPHRKDQTVVSKAHQWATFVAGKALDTAPAVASTGGMTWVKAGLSVATVNRRLCVLKAVCKWAWEQNLIAENLSPRIKLLPGEVKREVYLTRGQIAKLARCAPSATSKSAILLTAYSGLRASELLRLSSTPIGADSLLVSNTKSGKPRQVPIIPKIRVYLKRLPIGLTYRQLIGEFWIARKAAGLDHVRWHDLRHSAASMLVNAGVDLYVIGKILGHASMQTTSRYAHLEQETLRAAMGKLGKNPTKRPPD